MSASLALLALLAITFLIAAAGAQLGIYVADWIDAWTRRGGRS